MNTIRVLLVEDHTLVRAGIRALLKKCTDIDVVAEADTGRDALRLIKAHQPDVVLMDIAMPELNGLEAARMIKREYPHVHVMILSMYDDEEYIGQALRAGAAGYLLKGANAAELELSVKAVARGGRYLSPAVSKHIVDEYLRGAGGEPSAIERLTPRQREILQLIAEGHTTKEIAEQLNIAVKTVEVHRAHLMEQLDVHDIAGVVRYAIRKGIAPLDL